LSTNKSFVSRRTADEKHGTSGAKGGGRLPETEQDRAFAAALRFIARKARSRRETVEYLERKGYCGAAAAVAVSRLDRYGYLNDEDYARMLVDSRTRHNPRGITALREELISKGVDEVTIDSAVEGVDERDAARRAVERGLYRWRREDRKSFFRKVMTFLGRRGFPYDVSAEVCREAWQVLSGNCGED
jgi:regulatory protein